MLIVTDVTKLRRDVCVCVCVMLFHPNSIYGGHNVISLFKAHVSTHSDCQEAWEWKFFSSTLMFFAAALWV